MDTKLKSNRWGGLLAALVILGTGTLVALLAFVAALIKPLGMTDKKLFRAPLEAVLFLHIFSRFFSSATLIRAWCFTP